MDKHTPGPWRRGMDTEDQEAIFGNKDHPLICTISKGEGRPHGEANARLIAAAPELLAALKGVVEFTGAHGGPYVAARAAIAKAEGR